MVNKISSDEDLYIIHSQSGLTKDALSRLGIELGEAMSSKTSLRPLTSITHSRAPCLPVCRYWSPELWLTYHDDDERNLLKSLGQWPRCARKAPRFYLCHENASMRSS
ncbi:hypothetical protein JOM56_014409 [Amanita muscaria]